MQFYRISPLIDGTNGNRWVHIYEVDALGSILRHMHFIPVEGLNAVEVAEQTMHDCYSANWMNIRYVSKEAVVGSIIVRQLKERAMKLHNEQLKDVFGERKMV